MARNMQQLPVFVSIEEAADIVGVSPRTIRRRIADGTIPAYHCGTRPIRIRLDELLAALQPIPAARPPALTRARREAPTGTAWWGEVRDA